MKELRIILRIFIIALICVCLMGYGRDIANYVPSRLTETGNRIETVTETICRRFVRAIETSAEEVKELYDELVS